MRKMTSAQRHDQWCSAYDLCIQRLPKGTYSGEAVRLAIAPIIGNPRHPNCWGAAFRLALKRHSFLRPLQKTVHMTDPTSHGRLTRLYRKVR